MRTAASLLIAALLATGPALAEDFSAVKDKGNSWTW